MEKYESLGVIGEGSYGTVLKCRHRQTGQLVAIKKFLETKEDGVVNKIAMREIRLLKQLRYENLVNLIEVFCRKKHLYLVFEFVDHTVLDDLDQTSSGLDEDVVRRILWQVLKAIHFCHVHNIIHRDIKPENILVSASGIIKLCDFGFARTLAKPGEIYTDYVATRWYRAPELLVGDTNYGRAVDVWAVGCLAAELLTGEPLFPGDSDVDQLHHIAKCLGNLSRRHLAIFHSNPLFRHVQLPRVGPRDVLEPLEQRFNKHSKHMVDFMQQCLRLEASDRPTCSQLLRHQLFIADGFASVIARQLRLIICRDYETNPLTAQTMRHRYERCRRKLQKDNLNGCATSDSGYGHSKMDEHSAAAAAVQPVGSTNCEQTPPHHHHQQQEQQYTGNNDGDDRPRSHQLTQQAAASREHVGKPARRLLPDPSKCRKQQQQQGYVSTTSGSKTSYSDQPSDTTQAHTLTTLRYPQQHRRPDSDRAKCYRQQ